MVMDDLNFEKALKPENWTVEHILHVPTFEAYLQVDGTLRLRGSALREGFSPEAAQALTRFLSEHVTLPPIEQPYDFSDFTPRRVDLTSEDTEQP
jgi:hypothetical protein